jgi:hypothetical protein
MKAILMISVLLIGLIFAGVVKDLIGYGHYFVIGGTILVLYSIWDRKAS